MKPRTGTLPSAHLQLGGYLAYRQNRFRSQPRRDGQLPRITLGFLGQLLLRPPQARHFLSNDPLGPGICGFSLSVFKPAIDEPSNRSAREVLAVELFVKIGERLANLLRVALPLRNRLVLRRDPLCFALINGAGGLAMLPAGRIAERCKPKFAGWFS